MLRTRNAQRADRRAIEALVECGVHWELVTADLDVVYELRGRIVGASAAQFQRIARPQWTAPPWVNAEAITQPGPDAALVGRGLVLAKGLQAGASTQIHRLARTLLSCELGAKWCVSAALLPEHNEAAPAAFVLNAMEHGTGYPPIDRLISDGYWPTGFVGPSVILVRQNEEF